MMCDMAASADKLLPEVKNHLNITWDDETTDSKIRGLIADGMFYLNNKAGLECDYTVLGYPRSLLKEYVRYARDSALDVFENNYRAMILAMQNDERVKRYVDETL